MFIFKLSINSTNNVSLTVLPLQKKNGLISIKFQAITYLKNSAIADTTIPN